MELDQGHQHIVDLRRKFAGGGDDDGLDMVFLCCFVKAKESLFGLDIRALHPR